MRFMALYSGPRGIRSSVNSQRNAIMQDVPHEMLERYMLLRNEWLLT